MMVTRRFVLANVPGLLFALAAIWFVDAFVLALAYHGTVILLAVADALLGFDPRAVSVERRVDDKLSLGESAEIELRVRNVSNVRATVDVVDQIPETFHGDRPRHHLKLAPREERTVRCEVRPLQRGGFAFGDIWVRSVCRMGLASRRLCLPAAQEVRVYPNLKGIRRAELLGRKNRLGELGIHRVRFAGQGSEFEQLRDYNWDDDYRRINWKATAKRSKPITVEYQIERSQNVLLCLDAGHMMASVVGWMTKLDYAVNAAALLGHAALSAGDRVGLVVFSHDVVTHVAPSQGVTHMTRLIDALYAVQPSETRVDYMALVKYLAVHCKRRSLLAIFTDLIDTHQGEELLECLRLVRGRHLPLCLTFRDTNVERLVRVRPDAMRDVYTQGVAREVSLQRRRLLRDLTQSGAHVIDTLPEDLSVQAINKYLTLKARQLL